jgi:hypothetical protein
LTASFTAEDVLARQCFFYFCVYGLMIALVIKVDKVNLRELGDHCWVNLSINSFRASLNYSTKMPGKVFLPNFKNQ